NLVIRNDDANQVWSLWEICDAGVGWYAHDLIITRVHGVNPHPVLGLEHCARKRPPYCRRGVAPITAIECGLSILCIDAIWLSVQISMPNQSPFTCTCSPSPSPWGEGIMP